MSKLTLGTVGGRPVLPIKTCSTYIQEINERWSKSHGNNLTPGISF
jgi:hypothetical protein